MIYFLAPFYNEQEYLEKFISNLTLSATKYFKQNYKIVLVNDGSMDGSVGIVKTFQKKYPIILISYKHNKGVDFAFKLGFEKILDMSKNSDLIVTLESDNTSDLTILPKMIEKVNKGADIVLASCYAKGGGIHGTGSFRQLTSKIANFILYIVFPIKGVKTYSSFYRILKVESFKKARIAYRNNLIKQKGFVCMVEMLIKFSKLPIKIEEVPMILRWENRRGKSKMKIGKTVLGYCLLIIELSLKEKFGSGNIIATAQDNWSKTK